MVTSQSNSAPFLPTPSQNNNHKKSSNWNGNQPCGPCQICGYRNHTADHYRCRYSCYNSHNQNAAPHANYSSTGHSQNNCASSQVPIANYTHGGSTMPWYPDTAANYHITLNLANLSIAHDYNGHDQLHVNNGQASQAPKDSSNFPWLHIKSVPPSSTGSVGNSAQSPPLITPPSSHSPIPQQSPSSDSTTDPPLSLTVDLTHYPAQLNAASSTSTSPPRIHPMQLHSSTMQNRHACLSTKAKNYLITEPQTFTQAKPYA
ncbi:hypothetical protein CK203_052867 [Vitis vinifera]|uniref:Retrovirus-related Pol polyprotein from transposon RE2 n=1 Tax=Vitis vinifera TaxID=29760 RepID=A0A438H875_VITVI|nr:hypothetical protein CK203_052867 [Vitis vinifera]